jgi:hypothetical protein
MSEKVDCCDPLKRMEDMLKTLLLNAIRLSQEETNPVTGLSARYRYRICNIDIEDDRDFAIYCTRMQNLGHLLRNEI